MIGYAPEVPRDLNGHRLDPDPPANPLTSMRRLTCSSCGRAVIVRPNGTTYGSATERQCQDEVSS